MSEFYEDRNWGDLEGDVVVQPDDEIGNAIDRHVQRVQESNNAVKDLLEWHWLEIKK